MFNNLETITNLCLLQYGDLVHGARALAGEWSDTRFDLLPCNPDSDTRAIKGMGAIQSKVYPNPTINKLYLDIKDNLAKITILDVHNRLILQTRTLRGDAIDVSNIPAGLYLISAENVDGIITLDKFIKIE